MIRTSHRGPVRGHRITVWCSLVHGAARSQGARTGREAIL
ncbi:unnamed protein product [Staurois parvus]|uniref:Uncharacterized protein n=1 Tax=Staurois parvus TaxID=386267 RepID=A0ABN9DCR6_9NEOB|nr:unnamed protein product [Staurois parvus]